MALESLHFSASFAHNTLSSMYPQPDPVAPLPQTEPFPSPFKNPIREYTSRRRYCLSISAIIVLLVMGTGIVFAAHHYYVSFGGQGFLRAKDSYAISEPNAPKAYLPLRKVAAFSADGPRRRRSPMEVPYYACGDQQSSCEASGQPVC
jgi:hypothetical protein